MFILNTKPKLLTIIFLLLIPLTSSYAVNLLINEIYPDPVSEEYEWIEIYNYGETPVNKNKIIILDANNNKLTLNVEVINPGEYALATSSSKLNNTGDSIFIYYEEITKPIASATYSASIKGKSISLCPNVDTSGSYLKETDPSPNSENNCPVSTPTSIPNPTPTPETTPTSSFNPTSTIISPSPTHIPTLTPTPTNISTQIYYVKLSEVYPNPNTGELEWVEIYNPYDFEINLENYFIDDIESGSSPISFSAQIKPKNYFVLEINKSIFNNSADSVRILSPLQELIDSFSYSSTEKGKSWAKDKNGIFCLQEPSKGAENNLCKQESNNNEKENNEINENKEKSTKETNSKNFKNTITQSKTTHQTNLQQASYIAKFKNLKQKDKKNILGIENKLKTDYINKKENLNDDRNKKLLLSVITNSNIFLLYIIKKLTEII